MTASRFTIPTRRRFLRMLAGAAAAAFAGVTQRPAHGSRRWAARPDHPDPRPDIDGTTVLTADRLTAPHLAELFDAVREIPHIADGLRCYCGCASVEGYRSLFTCYEAPGMAQCDECAIDHRLLRLPVL